MRSNTNSAAAAVRCAAGGTVLIVAGALMGCGAENDWKQVYPVSGSLLVDGKPAAGAIVSFLPEQDLQNPQALRSTAEVQADGTFRVTTYMAYDGAPAGPHVVTAYWPEPLPENASPTEVGKDRLRGRYARASSPLARVTIEQQENILDPFLIDAN